MKKLAIAGIMMASVFFGERVFSQNMEDLVKGGAKDASYLVEGYASPLIKGFAGGLNQGWYNSAETHKFFGADLTLSVSLLTVPSSDKKFTVDNSKMTSLQLDGTASGKGDVPTFFGSPKPTNQTFSLKAAPLVKYDVPAGVDFPFSMVPMIVANLGISLPKGTDIKIRYVPTIDLGDDVGELGLYGIAVQHDIKQHIPGIKSLPFSLSALVGYTKFQSELVLDDSDPSNVQTANFDMSGTTIQALISKEITVLTIYGGVGYDIGSADTKLEGTYDTNGDGDITDPTDLKDPVDFSINTSTARFTAGLRLKFGPITFHGDYTLQKYNAITAGFGIYVR